MDRVHLSRLPSHVLLHQLKALVSRDHVHTAELIGHLAEVDRRRLHRPAGYPSMFV